MPNSSLSSILRFLLAWMAVPSFFRLLAFVGKMPHLDTPGKVLYVGSWTMAAGVPQDLFIALQALLIVVLLKAAIWRLPLPRRELTLTICTMMLFAVVHLYLLCDYLLYLKLGLRLDCSMLDFLPAARSFTSSALELGIGSIIFGFVLIGAVFFLAYRLFRQTVGSLRFSLGLAAGLPLVGLLAIPAREAIPAQVGYSLNNLVLNDQHKLVTNWIDPGLHLSAHDEAAALELITPRAERFQRVSPDYPLLKRTLGFTGEKTFNIRIEPGERPHVIFLFMESFRARDIGVLGGKHNASPNFDRLSKEGVLFTNFYGNGVQTTRGVIASLFGVQPIFSMKSIHGANSDLPMIGVADLFRRRGYTTAYHYAGDLAFERQDLFFRSHNYDELHCEDQVVRAFPKAEKTSWGYHDEYLMRYLADWLAKKDRAGQPTFSAAFTISHHHPWKTPSHYQAPKFNVNTPTRQYAEFLQTFHYADHCLGMFVDLLRRRGLDRKTILFVVADTAAPMGEHFGNVLPLHLLYEENVHIPLLILAPGRLDKPRTIADVGSQVDLMPTVMDMFSMTGLNHAVGTSLMRRVEGRTAYFNCPFVLQYLGLRRGDHKYFYTAKTRKPALFDMTSDRDERTDIAEQSQTIVDRYHHDTALVHQLFLKLYATEQLASPAHVDEARKPERADETPQ